MGSRRWFVAVSLGACLAAIFIGWAAVSPAAAQVAPSWTESTAPSPPNPARSNFASVYDPVHDVFTIFGGFGQCVSNHLSDVWTLTGAASTTSPTWVNRTPATGTPTGRWGSRAVYDPLSNRMTIFGGNLGCSSPDTNEVLLLANANGIGGSPAWIPVASAGTAPAPRGFHSAVYDPLSNSMIVQGGDNAFTQAAYGDTWALRNANGLDGAGLPATPTWVEIHTSPSLQFHSDATAVYNPASNEMIVFGGIVCSDPPTVGNCVSPVEHETNKVWILSNANGLGPGTPTWSEVTPTGTPPPARSNQFATYDVANDRMIVFGGSLMNDTWVLSGATGPAPQWQQLTPDPPLPPARCCGGAGYNPGLNTLLIFGGSGAGGSTFSDTWVLSDANGILPPPPSLPNVVVNTNDSGPGSLRAAIDFANTDPGPDTISFAIPPTDPGFNGKWFTIKPLSQLPPLTDDGTTIDGATQTAFGGDTNSSGPEIEINGSSAPAPAFGLDVHSSNNHINSLVIDGFHKDATEPCCHGGDGIDLRGLNNVVTGSYIGIDPTGTSAVPNDVAGIGVTPSAGSGNRIGGTTTSERNDISGNGRYGVLVLVGDDNTTIEGNYIGTNATGTAAIGNGPAQTQNQGEAGIHLQSNQNTISGNLISGNTVGIGIFNETSTGNLIRGNSIGTNAAGDAALPNTNGGLQIGSSGNTIGGASPSDRNVISGNGSDGLTLSGPSNRVQGNYIGTNGAGTSALPNAQDGVFIANFSGSADANVIAGNVVSGNAEAGVHVARFGDPSQTISGTVIQGNLVGTNAAGDGPVANQDGVRLDGASNSVIGGTDPAVRNVVSGNNADGIALTRGSRDNSVQGNYIGTNAAGSAALGNNWGVDVQGFPGFGGSGVTSNNVVAGNTVSGNHEYGVFVGPDAPGTTIKSNRIGTNAAGTAAVGNGVGSPDCCPDGIRINNGASEVTIGGPSDADRNVISGNDGSGIGLIGSDDGSTPAANITIQGNYIGTDATATTAIPNVGHNGGPGVGVRFYSGVANSSVTGNVISGNAGPGVFVTADPTQTSTTGNTIQGNEIGTNAAGTAALANRSGIFLSTDAGQISSNTIAGNLVSGNLRNGIVLGGAGVSANVVRGNSIGLDAGGGALANGSSGLPDNANGIAIDVSSRNKLAQNRIAYNAGNGVVVFADGGGVGNTITQNAIFSNGKLGIDLGGDGVTPNDAGDGDTGPNNLQNFPVIQQAVSAGGKLRLSGTIDTPNPASVTIELFANAFPTPGPDPSGFGEGAVFIGTATPAANGRWSASLAPVTPGTIVSATATDANGNTSEFSRDAVAK